MISQILYLGGFCGLVGFTGVSLFKLGKYSQRIQLEALIKNPNVDDKVKEKAVDHLVKNYGKSAKDWSA